MKRLLIFISFFVFANESWSQLSKGIMITMPSATLDPGKPEAPIVSTQWLVDLGWHRQKWMTERRFRVWDFGFGYGSGKFSTREFSDVHHFPPQPNAKFRVFSLESTWKLGFPLFHREYDDPFFWYVTTGFGLNYLSYSGMFEYNNREFYFIDEGFQPKFLDLGFGFEKRMGADWYYNMSANLEATNGLFANIKVRFLRRSY